MQVISSSWDTIVALLDNNQVEWNGAPIRSNSEPRSRHYDYIPCIKLQLPGKAVVQCTETVW